MRTRSWLTARVVVVIVLFCALLAGSAAFAHEHRRPTVHPPRSTERHGRIADYLQPGPAESAQCKLPVAQRTGGWFCY